jgi:Domain of unknown function (DUF4351)/Bacteriorhodopsin-like protein
MMSIAKSRQLDKSVDRQITSIDQSETLKISISMCGLESFIVGRIVAQIWLQIGVVSMTVGSLVFGYGASHAPNQRWQILYTLNFFICLIAAGLYLAMSLGLGFQVIYDRPTFWVRYITWFCSTRVEEARSLVIRQLTRKLGSISPLLLVKIEALSIEQVELLGEDLLDFTSIDNLEQWLA